MLFRNQINGFILILFRFLFFKSNQLRKKVNKKCQVKLIFVSAMMAIIMAYKQHFSCYINQFASYFVLHSFSLYVVLVKLL